MDNITDSEAQETCRRLGIDVPKWAASVRQKVRAARLKHWARRWGLAGFGYAQDDFHGHHQLLWVWRPFRSPRFEVWRWPVCFGSSDLDQWMKPLQFGSPEAYHRIEFSAERVYAGQDFEAAKDAMVGRYPQEIAAMARQRLPGDPR